jgi:hypothetical protein
MTYTYTEKTTDTGWEYIELIDDSKPESVTFIPKDLENPMYHEYLNKDKPKQTKPFVIDEA